MATRLGSPNAITWQYYQCLLRQIERIPRDRTDDTQRQEIVLVVFLAVSVVETFLNSFFRVAIEDPRYVHARRAVLDDFDRRVGLERKIRRWPELVFGQRLDEGHTDVRAFVGLKNLRNELMHFVSSHESVELPGSIHLHGMADLSAFHALSPVQAQACPAIVTAFVDQVLLAGGLVADDLPHARHLWFGDVPAI